MTGQAGAGGSPGAEAVGRARVQGWVSEGTQELRPLVGVRQHPEAVEGAQGIGERGGGRGRGRPDTQVGVVRQRQVGREGVGQVARGRRVAHHVCVEGRVGWVGPRHGQTLALVFHPAVLKPHLVQRHTGSNINHHCSHLQRGTPVKENTTEG